MKNMPYVVAIFLASAVLLQAQNSTPPPSDPGHAPAQNIQTTSNLSAAQEFRGDSEIQSDIRMSLEDHHVSGVNVKVTDTAIDLSGKLPEKAERHLAHDIAAAYADGRKIQDHTKR